MFEEVPILVPARCCLLVHTQGFADVPARLTEHGLGGQHAEAVAGGGRRRAADKKLSSMWLARRYAGMSEVWEVRDPEPAGRIRYGGPQLGDQPERSARMPGCEVGDGCGGERWRQYLEVVELAGLRQQMRLDGARRLDLPLLGQHERADAVLHDGPVAVACAGQHWPDFC